MIEELTVAEILYLHSRISLRTGGASGVRDIALLESAATRPLAVFGGAELYPSVFDKAAALAHSIISNHPFVDGNKRAGIAAAVIFLRKNGHRLSASQKDLVKFTLRIAQGALDVPEIAAWLQKHSVCE